MSIVENVEKVLKENGDRLAQNDEFRELRRFYEEMQREGLATRQEYTLPPLDTGGQRFHDATTTSRSEGRFALMESGPTTGGREGLLPE